MPHVSEENLNKEVESKSDILETAKAGFESVRNLGNKFLYETGREADVLLQEVVGADETHIPDIMCLRQNIKNTAALERAQIEMLANLSPADLLEAEEPEVKEKKSGFDPAKHYLFAQKVYKENHKYN